jgi:solute carrier family 23 (nucleobase transporter), member 1
MASESQRPLLYGIDDKPPLLTTLGLGFQHYLTMFGSTVAIPFILSKPLGLDKDPVGLGWLICTMFFVSGITTLLQTTWGNKLPIIQGGTFSFLGPTIAIVTMASLNDGAIAASLANVTGEELIRQTWQIRLTHVQGAVIIGAIAEIGIGYSGLVGKMLRFVGPITIAPTIALIGLALFKFGAPVAGSHWPIGALTIGLIILFSQYLRKTHRFFELFPILLAIVAAWGVAALCTALGVFPGAELNEAGEVVKAAHPAYVNTATIGTAPWFRVPLPFQWGWPQFGLAAAVGMFAGYMASMVESVGDYYACARLAGAPPPDAKTVNRGIGMEGIGCLIAGIFGTGNGTTSYSENIGAIGLTRVGSRRVVQAGAAMMIVLGVVGKFGAVFTTIPGPIVGGMYCAMFGMIASVGMSNLQFVNLNSGRNLFILGFAFFMGLSVPEYFSGKILCHEAAGYYECVEVLRNRGSDILPAALAQYVPAWLDTIVSTIGRTGMAVGALIAVILDNTIPGTPEERGLIAFNKRH